MIKINLKIIYLSSVYLKFIVILATIFFIGTLGYFFSLRPKLEMKEISYLNLLSLEKKLNEQLKITAKYYQYREKIKNLKNKYAVHVNEQVEKFISSILGGQLTSF